MHSIETEKRVLGTAILHASERDVMLDNIQQSETFYDPKHREIFTLIRDSKKPGYIDLVDKRPDWKDYIADLVGTYTSEMEADCLLLIEHYVSRVAQQELFSIQQVADKMDVFDLTRKIYEIADNIDARLNQASDRTMSLGADLTEVVAKLETAKRNGKISGLPSGLSDIDRITAGWQNGNLIVLAARPGMGKSALALSFALNAGVPVAIASIEMSRIQIMQRAISNLTGINLNRIIHNPLTTDETTRIITVAGDLMEVYVNDPGEMDAFKLRSWAKKMANQFGCKMIIVDYMQLLNGHSKDGRERVIAEISRTLKAIARELDIPVMALSQLNRDCEKRADKRPILADLRESGSIEQDADMVMFLFRESVYNDEADETLAEVEIAKHRQGVVGTVELEWHGNLMRFKNKGEINYSPINQSNGKDDYPF